jgi:FAD/FMN-containing dehydrogenase
MTSDEREHPLQPHGHRETRTKEEGYMDIVKALENIVGPRRVSNSQAVLQSYKYNCWLGREWEMKPDIVVLAETTEQVSAILKAANKYKVPVTPKGTMGGGGLGGTFKGGILLDLSLMEKIISINTDTLKAVAEAGCSFYKLSQELFKRGLILPTAAYDCGPNVAASAITPANGFGKTKYGPNIDLVEGFEVVLPSGEIARVGAMAYADTDFGPYYRYITGPDLVGLFTKSNGALGIVTKVVYQCLRRPAYWAFHGYYWPFEQLDQVTKTLMRATDLEIFDIHFNDKYRWEWEQFAGMPETGYFDVTMVLNAESAQELKSKEAIVDELCKSFGGTYLPRICYHMLADWPTIFFAAHPHYRPDVPPNIMNQTLGPRGSMSVMDELTFPTSWLTEVYMKLDEFGRKHQLDKLPHHTVFDGYPMKRQVVSSQLWTFIDDASPEWVERFMDTREDFRKWYGERGGLFQTKFPPLVPEYTWTNQESSLNLLKTIKQALDPNNVLSPYTFAGG